MASPRLEDPKFLIEDHSQWWQSGVLRRRHAVVALCVAEDVATEFISGPPAGRVPAISEVPFHDFTPEMAGRWNELVAEEEEILTHQSAWLDTALAGRLTEDALNKDMHEYWLNGLVGRAYVLDSDMIGAIYTAFSKEGVFTAIRDPRRSFELYNATRDAKPEVFKGCPRAPDKAVKQALAICRAGTVQPRQ